MVTYTEAVGLFYFKCVRHLTINGSFEFKRLGKRHVTQLRQRNGNDYNFLNHKK